MGEAIINKQMLTRFRSNYLKSRVINAACKLE